MVQIREIEINSMAEKIVRIRTGSIFGYDSGLGVPQRHGCPGNIVLNGMTPLRRLARIYSFLLPRDKGRDNRDARRSADRNA